MEVVASNLSLKLQHINRYMTRAQVAHFGRPIRLFPIDLLGRHAQHRSKPRAPVSSGLGVTLTPVTDPAGFCTQLRHDRAVSYLTTMVTSCPYYHCIQRRASLSALAQPPCPIAAHHQSQSLFEASPYSMLASPVDTVPGRAHSLHQ